MKNKGNVFGGILLVAGTAIGAGMLGLPVVTAAAGFFPTLGVFLLVWLLMTGSALAYLEIALRFKGEINLISMAEQTLGTPAKIFAWITFIAFLYSLMAAYTAGGTTMLAQFLKVDINGQLELCSVALLFVLPYAFIVYLGTLWVDRLNRLLMLGLIITFVAMCVSSFNIGHTVHFYPVGHAKYLIYTLPLIVTSFGYHLLIPTLKTYLNSDVKKLRTTIIVGGLMPLLIYMVWEFIILNLVPTWGVSGLIDILHGDGNPADGIVRMLHIHGNFITMCISWFSFFALTTSFIGVGLGIVDFLSDGLHIKKSKQGRTLLGFLTFVPPVLYTMIYPQGFLVALRYAAIFATILLVIYPGVMAWYGRYVRKLPGTYQMRGGKITLAIIILFGIFVIAADVFHRLELLPVPRN